MASQITSFTIVCSTVYSGVDQRKHQISASLAFMRGIHRWPVNSPHKGQWRWKLFHLMTSSCILFTAYVHYRCTPVKTYRVSSSVTHLHPLWREHQRCLFYKSIPERKQLRRQVWPPDRWESETLVLDSRVLQVRKSLINNTDQLFRYYYCHHIDNIQRPQGNTSANVFFIFIVKEKSSFRCSCHWLLAAVVQKTTSISGQ